MGGGFEQVPGSSMGSVRMGKAPSLTPLSLLCAGQTSQKMQFNESHIPMIVGQNLSSYVSSGEVGAPTTKNSAAQGRIVEGIDIGSSCRQAGAGSQAMACQPAADDAHVVPCCMLCYAAGSLRNRRMLCVS